MCNRYKLTVMDDLEERFQAWEQIENCPRYNIAPTQPVATVCSEYGKNKFRMMRWQLIPHWATTNTSGSFNARSEKATTTPSFSDAIVSRRCLIPADGFYEWRTMGKVRQPYCFELGTREVFAFAGLWDEWKGQQGCAILTTAANPLLREIHDRMPVILSRENYDVWLNSPKLEDALRLLEPYDAAKMRRYPVSTRLNDAKNEGREVSEPVELNIPQQDTLFG